MASIRSTIELVDAFSNPLNNITNAVNASISTMDQMQAAMNRPIDASPLEAVQAQLDEVTSAAQQMEAAMNGITTPSISPEIQTPQGVEVPVVPIVTDTPQIEVPQGLDVPITPIVTEQPQIETPENINIPVTPVVGEIDTTGVQEYQAQLEEATGAAQKIGEIEAQLSRVAQMQKAINNVASSLYVLPDDTAKNVASVNREIQRMQAALDYLKTNPFNLDSSIAEAQIESISASLDALNEKQIDLDAIMGNAASRVMNVDVVPVVTEQPHIDPPPPMEVPIKWQSDNFGVFTNTGVERFNNEVQSANAMLNTLNETQSRISAAAQNVNLFPANMVADMNGMHSRLQAIQQRIQEIENNPVNLGTDTANAELERLRAQLQQAISAQEALNGAVDGLDIQAANDAYLRLSNTISGTEQYIRDNVDEQGRFNRAIQDGVDRANGLQSMIAKAVGAFAGIAGVRKAFGFVKDSTGLFDTQRNAEMQLMSVLANMLDADYVAQFEIDASADTTAAVAEINAIQDNVNAVEIPVTAETRALTAAYDKITEKASEIQSLGIYGDEAMIAAGAEFATYFTDTDAITTMMGTLSNYAMGMSGGGAIDASAMVDYATNLGKIMSGSYDAMTKKGFEFTKAQKAIIEGTATQQQIIDTLGKEYVGMTDDMKAAAVISQIINESWAGLYENMSNTPQGKIIQLTNAWGDMKEVVGGQLYPYIILFVDTISNNWPLIESMVQGFTTGLQYALGVLSWLVEGAIAFGNAVQNNWGWISPIIYGMTAALLAYIAALTVYNTVQAISNGIKTAAAIADKIHAASLMMEQGATFAATAAQYGFNAALFACPITWIVVAIIALIAAFYAAVGAVNKFAGTSVSATGIIMGAFATMLAFIANTVVVPMYNLFATFVNFLANAFNDPVAAVKVAFYDMCLTVIGYIQNLASAIETLLNKIPGVQVDITSGLDSFYRGLEEAQQAVKDESGWTEYVKKMDFIDLPTAARTGYEFGAGLEDSISGFFDPSSLFGTVDIPTPEDYAPQLAGIGTELTDISDTVGKGLSDTSEELKYLRDIAEQEAINRFTTAEIHIEQNNQNNISSEMDLDGVTAYMVDGLEEAVAIAAEGVHT